MCTTTRSSGRWGRDADLRRHRPGASGRGGRYTDPGYQNDLQVSGDVLVLGFDSLGVYRCDLPLSPDEGPGTAGQTKAGVDIVRLVFDRETATFETRLLDCYLSSLGSAGAHTTTIHPSGEYLTVNTSFNGLEIVDIRSAPATLVRHDSGDVADDAHDVSFSRDGNTLYSAGLDSTRILDVTDIEDRPRDGDGDDPERGDRRAGRGRAGDPAFAPVGHELGRKGARDHRRGRRRHHRDTVQPRPERQDRGGALLELEGTPRKLGSWLYPNPVLAPDPLASALAAVGRTERACTIHVFRNGGNGSAGPGEIASGFDGVSRLPGRQFVAGHTAPARGGSISRRRRARATASPRIRGRRGATRSAGT